MAAVVGAVANPGSADLVVGDAGFLGIFHRHRSFCLSFFVFCCYLRLILCVLFIVICLFAMLISVSYSVESFVFSA